MLISSSDRKTEVVVGFPRAVTSVGMALSYKRVYGVLSYPTDDMDETIFYLG